MGEETGIYCTLYHLSGTWVVVSLAYMMLVFFSGGGVKYILPDSYPLLLLVTGGPWLALNYGKRIFIKSPRGKRSKQ